MYDQSLLEPNSLISTLVEVGKGEELTYLEGYIGPSESGIVRLYGDLNMTYYADIPQEYILHARNVRCNSNSLVQVFIAPSTKVRLYTTRLKKTKTVMAKRLNSNVEDLNWCLIKCFMDHDDTSDAYEKCAQTCEGDHPRAFAAPRLFYAG